ncbi:MAG: hypothetical protein HKN33_10750 [Pyrinomonadaceae bacterium]|nr:hypothetical protein [Pyrinomonadaceae bacterium]
MKAARIALFLVVAVFAVTVEMFPQATARTNEWRGLQLGVSSPTDAIDSLGNPSGDKLNQKFRPMIDDDVFEDGYKDFRVLSYKNIRGFKSVSLYFRDDLLYVIRLKPRDLKAFSLERAYDSEFEFVPDRFSKILIPGDYGRGRSRRPSSYPMFYFLLNETDEAFAIAAIDNNSVSEVFGGRRKSRGRVPGKVKTLDLISTELVSDDGADILK